MRAIRIRLIGHMTVLIEMNGVVILTDPWFGPRGFVERLMAPRIVPPAASIKEIGHIDILLVSHNHIDHCDNLSLETARDNNIKIVGPRSVVQRANKLGATSVVELSPNEVYRSGDLSIKALRAYHPLASDALAYLIYGTGTVFFSGDTRYTSELYEDLKYSYLDVLLVQAACAHYPLIGDDGMSISEVTNLVRAIQPQWVVPLHLHCSGKWLDRTQGIRIMRNNQIEIGRALNVWSANLEAEGFHVSILEPGMEWKLCKKA